VKTKLSPAVVGMFILGALLLAVVGFLSFGGSNIFSQPTRFVVYFDESVHGLELGSAVKINGVRLGRVAAITVRYDSGTRKALVRTVCEIDRDILADQSGATVDLSKTDVIRSLVGRGMRAKLNLQGISGLLFVELSFEDPRHYPADPRFTNETFPVIPAIPSPISEVQQSIIEIVADLKKVDFAGLSQQLKTLLATTNQKVSELDVKELAERVGRAADAVHAFVSSPESRQTFVKLNATLDDTRALLAKVDTRIGPAGDDLRQTLAAAQQALQALTAAAQTTQRFVQQQGQVGDELTQALRQITDAADSLERLADSIERNPSALIVGKKRKTE
jgi:paraquat-inducible protein B